MNNTKTKLSIAALLIALSTWLYFTPHLAVKGMRSAAEAKDAAKLAGYVNFPALKESLKASFNAKLASDVVNDTKGSPSTAFGAALAAAFINPMIDALVTPESLAMMMKGGKLQPVSQTKQSNSSEADLDVSMSYEGLDQFVVTLKKKGAAQEPLGLVFNRDGVISWKLSALRLPI